MNGDDEARARDAKERFERERFERARRMRNYAIAGTLLFLAALFFVMTMVRLGGHVAD